MTGVKLRIWHKGHKAINLACQVESTQGHGVSAMTDDVSSWKRLGWLFLIGFNDAKYLWGHAALEMFGTSGTRTRLPLCLYVRWL